LSFAIFGFFEKYGEGFEVWEPVFTYHGFRFVEVTGLPFAPTVDMVTGVHIRTGVEMAGNVVAPSLTAAPLNQLQHAIQWGLGCNFMSVISDCPQRDERKGWMGDSGLSLQPTHCRLLVLPVMQGA
jgi:alpha-L-rhamnosidase